MSTVTYSPEDNKLRLYVGRIPKDEYQRLRKAGFIATPKQDCDFAAVWTPIREDLASEYLDEDEDIGDEDYSPLERAADRAERFSGYREKRADEATGHADTFEVGPSAFGHQNRARAERQAARHDRERVRAVSQWSKAEYWQQRTAGVISHALHKASSSVRRGRILTIEKEIRQIEARNEAYQSKHAGWKRVLELPESAPEEFRCDTRLVVKAPRGGEVVFDCAKSDDPAVIAYTLSNYGHGGYHYKHPRRDLDEAKHDGGRTSLYSLLTDSTDPITPREAARLWLVGAHDPDRPSRWLDHLNLRLIYENMMLENEGGKVSEANIEPGGWFGRHQVQKVSKSNVTGRVVSVHVLGPSRNSFDRKGNPYDETNPRPMVLHKINIERLGEDAYRVPTDEERAEFATKTKAAKAKAKATAPKAPPLINPTDEDAERLQALWNERERAKHVAKFGENCSYSEYKPQEVLRITQAQYSANSKGDYAALETRLLYQDAKPARRSSNLWTSEGAAYDKTLNGPVCKMRMRAANGFYQADRVIVLTDKPQKPLPLNWEAILDTVTA